MHEIDAISGLGSGASAAYTSPQTYTTLVDVPRSPHQTNGECSERYCNGILNDRYKIEDAVGVAKDGEEWAFQNRTNSLGDTAGTCYRDSDCAFYYTDSSGQISSEIVGTCDHATDTHRECTCTYPFHGRNCQLKHCPNSTHNQLECGGPDRGTCDPWSGLCTCKAQNTSSVERAAGRTHVTQHFGKACELRTCPNKCSNQGQCVAERDTQELICRCNPGFYSEDCSHRRCPLSYRGYVCDNHGTCNVYTGSCQCETGYYGRDCHYETKEGWYSYEGIPHGSSYISTSQSPRVFIDESKIPLEAYFPTASTVSLPVNSRCECVDANMDSINQLSCGANCTLFDFTQPGPKNRFSGSPNGQWQGLGTGGTVLYNLNIGGKKLVDGTGSDFNVYEKNGGDSESDSIDVLVSNDGSAWVDVSNTKTIGVELEGVQLTSHDQDFIYGYDISSTGLTDVRYIKIVGKSGGMPGGENGTELDGIGLKYTIHKNAAVEDIAHPRMYSKSLYIASFSEANHTHVPGHWYETYNCTNGTCHHYDCAGDSTCMLRLYGQPLYEVNSNPATVEYYERRSCHRDDFASNHRNRFGVSYHLTRDVCGALHNKYYGAYNETHYTANQSDYENCSKVQIVESTASGDLQGVGQVGSLNYATTTEEFKLC